MKPGRLIIVNEYDCPMASTIALIIREGEAEYITRSFQTMKIGNTATLLSEFGIKVEWGLGQFTTRRCGPGDAQYHDHRPRGWQELTPTRKALTLGAIRRIQYLLNMGVDVH